jgi:hypothetical protein
VQISDLLAESGYAYRTPEQWALPLRRLGISVIVDLHAPDATRPALRRRGWRRVRFPRKPDLAAQEASRPVSATRRSVPHEARQPRILIVDESL